MIRQLVLHSVSYSGSWGQHTLTIEEFLDKAADLGFGGVMLMAKRPHLSVLDWDHAAVSRLRSRAETHGLQLSCIAGYTNFTADLEHRDIPHREFQIQHVTRLAEISQDLGCSLIRVFTGYESGAAPLESQYKSVVDALRECAERASAFGVTIGVQNHHDIACDFESMYQLIREIDSPNCRAMFDAWAPALQGVDLGAAARKMAAVSVYTTIANYALRPRYRYRPELVNYEKLLPAVQAVPVDEGFIDYDLFLRELIGAGYGGPAAYEMCSPLEGGGSVENLDGYARRFVSFMQKFRDQRAQEATSGLTSTSGTD